MASVIQLDGNTLSPAEVYAVATDNLEINLSDDSWDRIVKSRKVVEDILQSSQVVYGINTGFGSLVDTNISSEKLQDLQINLIRSHATGLGEPMSRSAVKTMMVARINSFAKGFSGVHPNVVQQLIDYVNHDVTPYIPRIGSLGASGDLAPLSHMAITLIGEGSVINDSGDRIPTKDMLLEKGLIPVELSAKDGLSLINGTSQMLSYSILSLQILNNLLTISDVIYCTSLEAFQGSISPVDARVHAARPHPGQILVSSRVRQIMQDSEILSGHKNCSKVQDPYSFRCAPQVHGAVYEALISMRETIQVELNSTTDNPLVFPETTQHQATIISQGNFHGEILALCADRMSLALFELGSISERRMDQLLDSKKSGLPPFLATNGGLESGMMIVQYSAGSSLSEMHGHAAPRTSFSTSTSAGQEDHVSMGATACWNLYQSSIRLSEVLACELIIACQALEYNTLSPAPFVKSLYKLVRTISPKLTKDRSTSDELLSIAKILRDGSWLSRIEAENERLIR
ncbi:MAG: histidine ammonia-lyase [Candidatus Poseidoniaceae archaeon]|nr:histidine ammonia-lyase [Candidatus Poseidoniaceae archaeon]MBL6895781.1 histidine ammonia-lyase [Candidatus Poseidoniaceae archaeon]